MHSKFLSIVIYFFSFGKSNSKSIPVSEPLIETDILDDQLLLDTTQTCPYPVKSFLKESSPDHFFYYDFPDDFSIYYKNPDAIHLETQQEPQLMQSFNPECLSSTRMKRFIVLRPLVVVIQKPTVGFTMFVSTGSSPSSKLPSK